MATVTTTISAIAHTITVTVTSSTPSATMQSHPGIFSGMNPSKYDPKNPLVTFIIQAGLLLILCRLLYYPLSKIGQSRVIAEIASGIILGPSVFGHIPGFQNAIFPKESIPALNVVANLGLILYLFLMGLEVDLRFLVSRWRVALSVGTLGVVIPFGLGFAIAYGLHNQFNGDNNTVPVTFGVFGLFTGLAMAITAFPILCRIMTELKIMTTPLGIMVLSAAIGNDLLSWVLLALSVALVNASSGLAALWVLLVSVGYTLFAVFGIRPLFIWFLRKSDNLHNGPSQLAIAVTVLLVLASSFFTSIIGIYPIFGAFLVGVICPHEGGFPARVTEKLEDIVATLLLPLYFALSGLNTNLSLLNTGITWAYTIGIIAVAFFGKVTGGTLGARANGLHWRESLTIGVLMSCKGLIELIVINIGLEAKILSTLTFTMFVVMALVTTFLTTPLVRWIYPESYQQKLEALRKDDTDYDGSRADREIKEEEQEAKAANPPESS